MSTRLRHQRRESRNKVRTARYPDLFPRGETGDPETDHIATLVELRADPSAVPDDLTLRSLGRFGAPGESKYMMNRYLQERGDANVTSNADLIDKGTFYSDSNFPDRRQIRTNAEGSRELDTTARLQHRFAVRTIVLQCMQEQDLDVLAAPTASVPPPDFGPLDPAP